MSPMAMVVMPAVAVVVVPIVLAMVVIIVAVASVVIVAMFVVVVMSAMSIAFVAAMPVVAMVVMVAMAVVTVSLVPAGGCHVQMAGADADRASRDGNRGRGSPGRQNLLEGTHQLSHPAQSHFLPLKWRYGGMMERERGMERLFV